jgi:hypothetical protein
MPCSVFTLSRRAYAAQYSSDSQEYNLTNVIETDSESLVAD